MQDDNMKRKQEKDMEVINIRFPSGLISILDSLVDNGLYKSRSEAIREMLRTSVQER